MIICFTRGRNRSGKFTGAIFALESTDKKRFAARSASDEGHEGGVLSLVRILSATKDRTVTMAKLELLRTNVVLDKGIYIVFGEHRRSYRVLFVGLV